MPVISVRDALNQALAEEMAANGDIILIGQEIGRFGGTYGVTQGLQERFGADRVRDTPISEGVIGGAAIGASMVGCRVVAEFMTINFALLGLDMVANHAAKLRYMFGGHFKVPAIFRAPGGGGRQLGATHSQSFEAIFGHFPGLRVVCPATVADHKGMLKAALRQDDPVFFIESFHLYGVKDEVPAGDWIATLDKAEVRRAGDDVTIVAYSRMLHTALKAAEDLAAAGISAEVIDLRSIRPLDMEPIYQSIRKTSRAVVVEEGYPTFGIGAELAARIQSACFDHLDAPVRRVAQIDVPLPYNRALELSAIPSVATIVSAAKEVLYV
jgi:pyruvate dehydrogenase E1 component beta subunit